MSLRINTNVESVVAQHQLSRTKTSLDHTQNKLASGSRIIQAKDDAAGLAISDNLQSVIRATRKNIENSHNGLFLLQTADGALSEMTNIVWRMKELAVQAASDHNGDKERGYLNDEYQELKKELDRISLTTYYNGRPLLNGDGGDVQIQVGPYNNDFEDRILVAANFEVNLDTLGLDSLAVDTADEARDSLVPIDQALTRIAETRGNIGAAQSRLSTAISTLMTYEENTTGAYSQIRDADMALETSNYTKYNILNQAGVAILSQANTAPSLALKLLNG